MENYYINAMIVLRDKIYSKDVGARRIKPGTQSRALDQGQKIAEKAEDKVRTTTKAIKKTVKELPTTHNPLNPEGMERLIADSIGNTGKAASFFSPLPGTIIIGKKADDVVLKPVGQRVGKSVSGAMKKSAPLYKYLRPV